MALNGYGALKDAVAAALRRTDLGEAIGDFVALAEAQMNRSLKVRRRIGLATAMITDELSGVPDDFGGVRTVRLTSGTRAALAYVTPEQLAEINAGRSNDATGCLQVFSVVGDQFQFGPWPSAGGEVEISYYARIRALSDSVPSNWVLADHPDAYLYGALYHAAVHLKNAELQQAYGALFLGVIDSINAASNDDSLGGAMAPSASQPAI